MSDDKWFDALAGREAADANQVDLLEARLLRAALRREAASLAEREAKLEAMVAPLNRPRRRRLCAGCANRMQRLLQWLRNPAAAPGPVGALAALVLSLVLVPWWLSQPQDSATSPLRGGGNERVNGVCLLKDANPALARDDMARRLAATGARISSYERVGRKGLQASWPGAIPQEAHADLAACRFSPLSDEPLIVEFSSSLP